MPMVKKRDGALPRPGTVWGFMQGTILPIAFMGYPLGMYPGGRKSWGESRWDWMDRHDRLRQHARDPGLRRWLAASMGMD
jgi:hypothetical protein